jgi:alkylation response protein AidB-like acyl-CoA dehydrogenase
MADSGTTDQTLTSSRSAPAGGSFLLEPVGNTRIFIVEDLDEEQRAMAAEAQRFMEKEVYPKERWLESKEGKASRDMLKVLKKACDLGFCQVEVPEKFGGLGSDKVTALLITDKLGTSGDFCVTWGAHSGIGLAPILYFGTDEQKARYVPRIAECKAVSCYALSEPGSGSDALAARTVARLNPEGTHYILNGTKQWITNASWMDVGIVFAKVDGDKFTAFIVEKGTPGFTIGGEEHKLGLRGSSTCQLIFQDAAIPVGNVLGEVGKGHKIAFNTLNLGRYKLGVGVIAAAKRALGEAMQYAADRKQFGTRVLDFGAIRDQLTDSIIGIYLGESLVYRIAGHIDAKLEGVKSEDADYVDKQMAAIEEYAIEASAAKVFCSETLDRVLDRCLQWHGGYGFVEDYNVEKFVRDARVNRIFEGTNEINRLLIPGTLVKRATQRRLNLHGAIGALEQHLGAGELDAAPTTTDGTAMAEHCLQRLKWLTLTVLQATSTKLGVALEGQQETLVQLSNLIIDSYALDSGIARARQRAQAGEADPIAAACCTVAACEALDRAGNVARRVLEGTLDGEDLAPWLAKVDRLAAHVPANLLALRKAIAADAVKKGGYKLSSY